MTADVDIVNRALAAVPTRTNIASLLEQSNEAINANKLYFALRDELQRMAPWDCVTNYNNLTLVTAAPGTPENTSAGQSIWQKIWPPPNWAYEYLYPSDCLRARWVVPQFMTGFAAGVPITTAVTGGVPQFWQGPPQRFQVGVDQPQTVASATIVAAGSGYSSSNPSLAGLGDTIALTGGNGVPCQLQVTGVNAVTGAITSVAVFISGSYTTLPINPVSQGSTSGVGSGATFNLTFASAASAAAVAAGGTGHAVGDTITLTGGTTGEAVQLTVTSVNAGVITGVSIGLAGNYSAIPANPVAQGSTTGLGSGATFNITWTNSFDQKMIFTNQENAILAYNRRITDPTLWDSQFQQAMVAGLAARLAMPLGGNLQRASQLLQEANVFIQAARATDGNEGLTINDVSPDWIRIRGIQYPESFEWSPNVAFDWGPLLTLY